MASKKNIKTAIDKIEKKLDEKDKAVKNEIKLDEVPKKPIKLETEEVIPTGFVKEVPAPVTNESEIKIHNGRVYKELKNGIGMYADTGETFKLD